MPHRPIDEADHTDEMLKAVRRLRRERFSRLKVMTKYQLKIGDLSFYPKKGTIYRDGDPAALSETGIEALIDLLSSSDLRDEVSVNMAD